jgi:transposase-like protein
MHAKDSRGLAIKMYMHLRSYRKLAQLTGISKSTLHRWVTTSPVMQRNVKARKATA